MPRATSGKQQKAAGAALSAKRGERSKSSLKGASRYMVESMSETQLHDMASVKRKKLPKSSASKTGGRSPSSKSSGGSRSSSRSGASASRRSSKTSSGSSGRKSGSRGSARKAGSKRGSRSASR